MGCDFAFFAYCNKQGNCTDSFQKQKTWCIIVRYDAHHVFYINNSLCGVAKCRFLLLYVEMLFFTISFNCFKHCFKVLNLSIFNTSAAGKYVSASRSTGINQLLSLVNCLFLCTKLKCIE